jgi:hypothetical protein
VVRAAAERARRMVEEEKRRMFGVSLFVVVVLVL